MNSHRYCVVMCGGVGSRFWPFSRNDRPKQFLDFFGTGKSLLQLTVERIAPVVPPENVILVTNRAYAGIIREQLPQVKESNILLEPARRNTSPCVLWAARHIAALDPEASIVTVPSDHLVLKEDAFVRSITEGLEFVESGDRLLTLGIRPSGPNTGYGYIQQGARADGWNNIFKVKSFTEKPGIDMARKFIESGEFFWNAGIFLWSARSILSAFERLAPETAQALEAPAGTFGTPAETAFIDRAFPSCPSISIDYDIMEKADNVYVETVDLGWSDLGTWNALYEASPHNQEGNVTQNCKVLAQDCQGTMFAVSGDKIIVAAGLKDFIVADNGNALLICPRADEQRIRLVVNEVKNRFGEDYI